MTETTQPDPQVVAWMREQLAEDPFASDGEMLTRAAVWFGSVPLGSRGASLIAARKPSRLADIPAGQGPASLFIDERGGLRIRNADGSVEPVPYGAGLSQALRAVIGDHLAATLPNIAAEDAQ